MNPIQFSILNMAVCTPSLGSIPSLDQLSTVSCDLNINEQGWMPDMAFLPKRTFRKLSRLSKMGLYTAHHAVQGLDADSGLTPHNLKTVFCSRYGEYENTLQILTEIASKDFVSPLTFGFSVHNTTQGLFSILNKSQTAGTALASRQGVLEHAFVKAYTDLHANHQQAVLVVYQEDKLGTPYDELLNHPVLVPLSMAFVVSKPDENYPTLTLTMTPSQTVTANKPLSYGNEFEYHLINLFKGHYQTVTKAYSRLTWEWSYAPLQS